MRKLSIYIYLLIVATLAACGKKGEKLGYLTAKAERGDLNVIVTASGIINPDSNIAVGTQVSGVIAKIFVDYNSNVKKGQLVALIDTTPLKENVNDARANLEKARAAVFQTQKAFQRTKILLEGKAAAQADYDLAEANYRTALAGQTSARAQLQKALTNLRYAYIRAPISGTVVSRNVDVGQTVAASFTTPTLFTIANNLKKMQVQASVDEADIGQVVLNQRAVFTVDAFPDRVFSGKVSQIRLQPSVVANVVNYAVIIEVPNPDLKLMPGMTANITFQVKSKRNVLMVPAKALTFNPPGSGKNTTPQPAANISDTSNFAGLQVRPLTHNKLWVIAGDSIKQVTIKPGLSNGTMIEVEGEIKEGDQVVTGTTTAAAANASKSPFTPTFPTRRSTGGGH
jgi:HlyD family secretion protein